MILLASNVFLVTIMRVHVRSGTNLSAYANSANTVTETTKAMRGNIYDRNGTVIAQDSRTYNIICILSSSRPSVEGTIAYVKDKEGTANALSSILNVSADSILSYLNQDVYQTELGTAGRNLSQAVMEEIKALNMPGIEFTDSIQRVYPLGTFASNLIGFAQSDETGSTIGRMGAELYLDSYLKGIDGYRIYQADSDGYILPGMKENTVSATNGDNVYTTIDQTIQEALEESFRMTAERFSVKRVWGAVMEVKTGKILAWGQSPSFDPNTLEIADYNNYGAQLPYEPGSTLKTMTWAAAINEGVYDGTAKVDGGPYYFTMDADGTIHRTSTANALYSAIYNASKKDYGWTEYDDGLIYSANTIAASIDTELITPEKDLEYLKKFGFFNTVNSDGLPEESGVLNFTWPQDKISLSYGQGSTVTMLQLLQAYSSIFGDGTMVRPYYVDSIRNSYDDSVVYQARTKVTGNPITADTAKELQGILKRVVSEGSAKYYQIPECEIIGKTGTTQVAENGTYQSGLTISSIMSALPADDPQVIVYYAFEASYDHNAHYYTEAVQNLLRKTAMKLGLSTSTETAAADLESNAEASAAPTEITTQDMPDMINHSLDYAGSKLSGSGADVTILGDGSSVIDQYPSANSTVSTGQKVFLLTDTNSFIMPDMTGWTRKDVTALWSVTQFGFKLSGDGIVISQSIPGGTAVTRGTEIEVEFG
ncbi:MAG: penicillin-binding protein [Erysipelotrichia bacterium]|nr:penicillin-binding protein [Erysipelotrichia bacterium]